MGYVDTAWGIDCPERAIKDGKANVPALRNSRSSKEGQKIEDFEKFT